MKAAVICLILSVVAFYIGRRSASPPLADHKPYMLMEYPDIMAFTLAEMRIDKFLLDLEQRKAAE